MHSEQRQSYRFPTPAERGQVVLEVAGRRIPAIVMNESAGGYSVWVGEPLDLGETDVVFLSGDDRRCQVEVVHCDRVGEAVRLGLKRIQDLSADSPDDRFRWEWVKTGLAHRLNQGGLSYLVVGILFVAALGLAAVGWRYGLGTELDDDRSHGRQAGADDVGRARDLPEPIHGAIESSTPRSAWIEGTSVGMERLAELAALSSQEAADSLKLSPEQRARLDALLAQTITELERIRTEAGSVLTPEQTEAWRKKASQETVE